MKLQPINVNSLIRMGISSTMSLGERIWLENYPVEPEETLGINNMSSGRTRVGTAVIHNIFTYFRDIVYYPAKKRRFHKIRTVWYLLRLKANYRKKMKTR